MSLNIKNVSILIGREPETGKLLIAAIKDGHMQKTSIGGFDSVSEGVSRCYLEKKVAHCRIDVDANGVMRLHNLKPQNVTFVNNNEIISKVITINNEVALGFEKYPINLAKITEIVESLLQQMPSSTKEVYVDSLETVWKDYYAGLEQIRKKQKNKALLNRMSSVLSMLGMLVGISLSDGSARIYFMLAALIIVIYILIQEFRDSSKEDKDKLDAQFQKKYVCPNPDCKHFLGTVSYELLIQDKTCKYCRCKWLHK